MPRTTIRSEDITDLQVKTADIDALAITNAKMADDAVGAAELSATGTASADTFLRGDNSWAEVSGGTSWQAVKTANFTAVAGEGYAINTTSAAITVTLPASASVGDTIELVDYAGTWATNKVTVNPNSLKLKGQAGNLELRGERYGIKLVYVDATQGWLAVTSRTTDTLAPLFSMTGGTKTTFGSYSVHTFTTSGNLVVTGSGNVDILVVGGAGGGGSQHSGGGGAGGYRWIEGVALTPNTYSIVVGSGGAGGGASPGQTGSDGNVSSGLTYSSAGGGGGGSYPGGVGRPGGSGGGGGTDNAAGGSGNTPSTTPSQGNNGGTATAHSPNGGGGGGGGSAAVGGNGGSGATAGGVGGAGTQNNLDGNSYYWAAGGGGAGHTGGTTGGAGGIGGGGGGGNQAGSGGAAGGGPSINPGGAGSTSNPSGGHGGANTGSGGGGSGSNSTAAGNGGSGIVIVRHL